MTENSTAKPTEDEPPRLRERKYMSFEEFIALFGED